VVSMIITAVFIIYVQDLIGEEELIKFAKFFDYKENIKKITEVVRSKN
jgi:hypothetical protein